MTERTIPVTGNPFNITVAFKPRYRAKRERRASMGSVISMDCMHHQWSRYAIRLRDDLHDIEQPLTMISILRFEAESIITNRSIFGTSLKSRNLVSSALLATTMPC
jgi:hypothetical protein